MFYVIIYVLKYISLNININIYIYKHITFRGWEIHKYKLYRWPLIIINFKFLSNKLSCRGTEGEIL